MNVTTNARLRLSIAVTMLASLGCSLVTGLVSNQRDSSPTTSPSAGPDASATGAARVGPTETPMPPPWPEDEPLPASLEDIHRVGVEQGRWTEGEGLVLLLEAYFGQADASQIPGLALLPAPEANWLSVAARNHLEENPTSPFNDEIEDLYTSLLPPENNLRRYVRPQGSAGRIPGLAREAHSPNSQMNCRALWELGFPEDPPEGSSASQDDFYCFEAAVRQVDGRTFEVFYPLNWQGNVSDNVTQLAEEMADAMVRSDQVYRQHGDVRSATAVFLPWNESAYTGAVFSGHPAQWESCPIMMNIFSVIHHGPEKGTEILKRVMAHEMFHCFQSWNYQIGDTFTDRSDWWVEGTAEYFSNVVYPAAPNKHEYLPLFDERSKIYSIIELKYENYVFFQHLANIHGNPWLTDVLHYFPHDQDLFEHQAILDNYVPQDDFHGFGQAYMDQQIPDTGGGHLPIDATFNSSHFFEGETTLPYRVRPFHLDRYRLEYEILKHFVQVYDERTEGRISEKLDTGEDWISPRNDVRSFCSDPDSILLVTTTKPNQTYEVDFQIPKVDDSAWDMTTSSGIEYSGDHGLYTGAGTGPLILLSQSDSEQAEPLLNLTSGGVYIFETADGTEYVAYGERSYVELPSGSLQGEFSARFWADEWGPLRGDPPDFTATGSFEACPQE